jgi:Family of unknown function (DUF6356)
MKYFNQHLQDVGESYFQHGRHAAGFAALMFLGSLACLGHAIFPFLFQRTGSDVIRRLHDRMVVNRHRLTPKPGQPLAPESAVAPR